MMVVWVLVGLGPSLAQSADKKTTDIEAKGWFIEGQQLYKDGRYRDALVAFERAYKLSSRPNILRSIAYCHENLGQLREALSVLRDYLSMAEQQKIPEIRSHIRRIQERLEPKDPPPVVATPDTPKEPTPPPERSIEPRKQWRLSTGPAVGYGIGGAALIAGSIFGAQALSARSEAQSRCSTGDAGFCPTDAADALNRDASYSLFADISFGVGGAAVVGATVWMIVDNNRPSRLQLIPVGNGVVLNGRF